MYCASTRPRSSHLGEGFAYGAAHVPARDEMRRYEYGGRELGSPSYMKDSVWVRCGVLEGEEALPKEHKRDYCGLWFHTRCIGLLRVPKDPKERIACLSCLQVRHVLERLWCNSRRQRIQVRQFRVKPPPIDVLTQLALYDKNGRPRILSHGLEGALIPTMYLSCSCDTAIVSGLPCACMLAVARTSGAVLSYLHYHTHWFSNKLI